MNYYATFGHGQVDSNGNSLDNCYVKLFVPESEEVEPYWQAYLIMKELCGDNWSMLYPEEQKSQAIDFYNLTEIKLEDIKITKKRKNHETL